MLGYRVLTPVFAGADDLAIEDSLWRAWIVQQSGAADPNPGKDKLPYQQDVAEAWVNSYGYDGKAVFDESLHGQAKDIGLRLWLETLNIASHDLDDAALVNVVEKINREGRFSPPTYGKTTLHDDAPASLSTSGDAAMLYHEAHPPGRGQGTRPLHRPYSSSPSSAGRKAQFGGHVREMESGAGSYGAAHNPRKVDDKIRRRDGGQGHESISRR